MDDGASYASRCLLMRIRSAAILFFRTIPVIKNTSVARFHSAKSSSSLVTNSLKMSDNPPSKRRRTEDDASSGFNASTDINNAADLKENIIPLLPRDCKTLLLDIEGCTTSISFVHDILFPFARTQLEKHLKILDSEEVEKIANSLDRDLEKLDANHASRLELKDKTELTVSDRVYALMNHDVKATALKGLQGQIWKAGYTNRELKGHIYQDFLPLLQWCKLTDVNVYIYSSGSIGAQKLLFGNSIDGDLLSYLKGHFDTTSGNKKEHTSYQTIAKAIDVDLKEICFISDSEAELVAARKGGIGHCIMSVRPGNAPLTEIGRQFPTIFSLLQVCGSGK